MTFKEWVEKYQIGPGMNDIYKDVKLYSGFDGTVGDGWIPLLSDLAEDLLKMGWNRQVAQIKEKFGGLRAYIDAGTKEMYDRIDKAEELSLKICEDCGKAGQPRKGKWIRTLCDECCDKTGHSKETF